jgi:hypothetical protein
MAVRALAVAALVIVCAGAPSAVAAQPAGDAPPPAPIGPRIEIGGGAGLALAFPEVNALVSLPIGPQTSFELAVAWMPPIGYDVEHNLAQAQFRLPFGAHRRSRRSLLLGVTRIGTRKRHRDDSGFWGDDHRVVLPHAGASLQWPIGRQVDFRFDAQGLFTLDAEFPLVPRAVATFVWHPGPSGTRTDRRSSHRPRP